MPRCPLRRKRCPFAVDVRGFELPNRNECNLSIHQTKRYTSVYASDCRQNAFGQHSMKRFSCFRFKKCVLDYTNKHFWALFPSPANIASFFVIHGRQKRKLRLSFHPALSSVYMESVVFIVLKRRSTVSFCCGILLLFHPNRMPDILILSMYGPSDMPNTTFT